MKPEVIPQIDRATSTVSYVVIDPVTGATALVDSILDFDPKSGRISTTSADRMVTLVRERGLNPETRVFTGHDHKAPGRQDDAWESTGPEQRTSGINVQVGVSEGDLVALRTVRHAQLDLPITAVGSVPASSAALGMVHGLRRG